MRAGKAIFVFASMGFLVAFYVTVQLTVPRHIGHEPVEVMVKKGTSFAHAAALLQEAGLIRDKAVFIMLGRLTGTHTDIKPGYYSFWGDLSPWDVLEALRDGKIIERQVTILEGDSLFEISRKLAKAEIIGLEEFDALDHDPELLERFAIDAPSIEGYLFPDTYRFPKGIEPREALAMMLMKMKAEFDEGMRQRAREIGLSEREVLTLASIVEKEALLNFERPIISAVYHNRLKKGMPLQADPTSIYGVKPISEGITSRDIRNKTDYNTYFIKGLPPGPIASPGIKSIEAALYPSDVPYIFFVSNNDGTHTFSTTLREHTNAVRKFKIKRAAQRRAREG